MANALKLKVTIMCIKNYNNKSVKKTKNMMNITDWSNVINVRPIKYSTMGFCIYTFTGTYILIYNKVLGIKIAFRLMLYTITD